jgi:hypothetical protein
VDLYHSGQYDQIVLLDPSSVSHQSFMEAWDPESERGLRQVYREFVKEKDISLLSIASAGVEGINRITGSELSLNLSRDDDGEVSGFRFRGNRMSVDAPLEKSE